MGLKIIGGIYLERSVFPASEVIYGSGGRAAAALKLLDTDVSLVSFVGENYRESIEYHAAEWGVPLNGFSIPEIVSFEYYHGMSTPLIRPTRLPFPAAPRIEVDGQVILQFGMLEGVAVVHGERVVFDPQNPESPEIFAVNGSSANELAYVLNRGEARKLTGEHTMDEAAAKLLKKERAAVVVIKCGADGARVYYDGEQFTVAAYETNYIWPIGSGDIFAAVFAHFWATERMAPEEAARLASRGSALYCARTELPLKRDELVRQEFRFQMFLPKRKPSEALIYLAGPFFTMGQLWLVEETRNALRSAGFKVFSPRHDVGIGDADDVVPEDIRGLEEANALLALCDGLDAGTLFEVGYAVKKGIPVVAFGEQTGDEAMKMLRGTNCKVFNDLTTAIYHAQWEALK